MTDLIERCARIAETVDIPANGHPQIDAPTVGDARRVIAAAIRAVNPRSDAQIEAVRRMAQGYADFWTEQSTKNESRSEHYQVVANQFQRIATALSREDRDSKVTEIADRWPLGCHSPNSCSRNGRCMYIRCKHDGKDIAALASAFTASGKEAKT